jgi:predicted ATP-grasp superfamily ATP-dependent carboligase
MVREILILGASVRAAAQSARRAGLRVHAADMFGDADLREVCSAIQVERYPSELPIAAEQLPKCPWMYTGGLENYPRIVDAISRHRELLGNSGAVNRRVRDPWLLSEELASRRLHAPELATSSTRAATDQWLVKPLRSAGGLSVRPYDAMRGGGVSNRSVYLQKFIAGESASAVFLGSAGEAELLGATKQLIGVPGFPSKQFVYRGSIGPLVLSSVQRDQLLEIGKCLAQVFQLVGLFGVDVVLSRDEVWTIEVNPRYTASVEVLERVFNEDFNAIDMHIGCFTKQQRVTRNDLMPTSVWGKEVVYAAQDFVADKRFADFITNKNAGQRWPLVADVPVTGTRISPGHPICTVFADGDSISNVETNLTEFSDGVRVTQA